MVKKWSVSYPAVNGVEQRRVYVYLPPCTKPTRSAVSGAVYVRRPECVL